MEALREAAARDELAKLLAQLKLENSALENRFNVARKKFQVISN